MKGYGHDAVGQIEGFLDTIAMVNVNVDVHHTRMDSTLIKTVEMIILQQLENSKHNVVCVAETRGFGLLRMVKASRPVNTDWIQTEVNTCCSIYERVRKTLHQSPASLPNEAPQYSWQKSKMPSKTGLSSLYIASMLECERKMSTSREFILVLIYYTWVDLL